MTGKKLVFIINPISGSQNKTAILKQIEKRIPNSVSEYEIFYTTGPSHATDLARDAIQANADVVIAIGGDGTVNETATGLMHSDVALGIIPTGSGNGLSRHLGIPSHTARAIKVLTEGDIFKMDVCTVNDIPFFNVAGIGYDAEVAHEFAKKRGRGFGNYVYSTIGLWKGYKPKKYKMNIDGLSFKTRALMISFANGSQFGNNAFIAPNARLDDGLMDISILHNLPDIAVPFFAYQLFNRKIDQSKYTDTFRAKDVFVKQKGGKIHLDGEPFTLGKKLHFKVLPGALNILAPKEFIHARQSKHTVRESSGFSFW
jgi:YegS/Rv2252/BmrU family lipid kinase